MPNPMQQLAAFPGPFPRTGQGIATGQPRVGYQRAAQWGKYFCYMHSFDPLPASSVRQMRTFSIDGNYDFLIQTVALLIDNGGVLLQTSVSPTGETFEYAPIYGSNWGSGQHPQLIGRGVPEALARNSVFTLTATDAQTVPADNTVILAYHGCKVARNVDAHGQLKPMIAARNYYAAKPFRYPATFDALTQDNNGNATGPIPAGQTRIFSLLVDNEGDFDVQSINAVSDTPIAIQINSDSENWFLIPLRSDLIGGSLLESMPVSGQFSGEWPFLLPAPRLITAAGYIQVTVTNLDAENATRVQIVFNGTRLYPAGGC